MDDVEETRDVRASDPGLGLDAATVTRAAGLEWLVERYSRARARFKAAAGDHEAPRVDTFIALFEALNWTVASEEYLRRHGHPGDDRLVRALRFVRNRVHHHWNEALEGRTAPVGNSVMVEPCVELRIEGFSHDWYWCTVGELAEGRPDPDGELAYSQFLADLRTIRSGISRCF